MDDSPNLLNFKGYAVRRVVAAVIEAHEIVAGRRLLRWIWFPGQLALITWILVSLGPTDWDGFTFRVGFSAVIACYATWLLSWIVRLPGLYRRDFVLPRLERAERERAAREGRLAAPAGTADGDKKQPTGTRID